MKIGTPPLNLTANETYTGNTTVSNGVLSLSSNSAISNSTNIIILTGATFNVLARTNGTLTSGVDPDIVCGNGTVNGFFAGDFRQHDSAGNQCNNWPINSFVQCNAWRNVGNETQ